MFTEIFSPVTFFLGTLAALPADGLVKMVLFLVLAPLFGRKLSIVNLCGLTFIRQNDDSWTHTFVKPSLMVQTVCCADKKKYNAPDYDRMEMKLLIVHNALHLLVNAGIFWLLWDAVCRSWTIGASVGDHILAGFALGMLIDALCSIGATIYVYGISMKRLGGYTQSLIKRLRAGERIADMGMKPVSELSFSHPGEVEKMMYYGIYMLYLYDTDQIDAMRQPVREMTAYLRDRAFEPNLILQYYWLIFYYSRYELNPQLADCFLDKVSSVIFADKDANAKRVLGYYYFGIVRDIEAASRYVKEGLAVIDNFSTGDERDIEKILLLTLQDYINKYISANPSIPQASPIP